MNMNEVRASLDDVDIEECSGSSDPKQGKLKRVPSKSVREKKKDSHKRFLNKKTVENKLKPRLDAKRYFPEEDLAALLEECRRTAMQQPAKEVEIKVDTPSMRKLCVETVDYLYNVGKIQQNPAGAQVDSGNLCKVIEAQAVAKVFAARRHNGKRVETNDVEYVTRVEKRFTVIPKILNIYLEQIGQFEILGQKFIPKRLPPLRFSKLAPGNFLTGIERSSPEGIREVCIAIPLPAHVGVYVEGGVFTGDIVTMVARGHGELQWLRADSLSDFSELCQWYEQFISRCNRKAAGLLQNVVYGKGEGTPAQLVGSHDDPVTLQREIWCNKMIDQNTLQIGGLFGYGLDSTDIYHSEEIATIIDRIDMDGLYQRIQRCQKL